MRRSSVRSSLAALILAMLVSCASAPPAADRAATFQLEGMLHVSGSDPFGRALELVDAKGMRWRIEPGPFENELSLLGGHEVRVVCRGLKGGASVVSVAGYEMLPVDGHIPLPGIISVRNGSIWLVGGEANIVLRGPLAEALAEFDGHAVWVWGEHTQYRVGRTPGAVKVAGYVVMGNVPAVP